MGYGRAGDKELYRIALDAVGCHVEFLPHPGVAGRHSTSDRGQIFVSFALSHQSFDGALLGLHWAWGKPTLQSFVPNLPVQITPPLGGYAVHAVDAFTFPEGLTMGPDSDNFTWSVRPQSCHEANGAMAHCQSQGLE